ncbi:MAG: capsule biosynthesis protein [Paracoccaceae bacterium]
MNEPPKVRRFRTRPPRRAEAPAAAAPSMAKGAATDLGSSMPFAPAPEDDGFGDLNIAGGKGDASPLILGRADAEEIEAVRAEGIDPRQLRLARRVALKNGIEATTDYEAVALLRRKGIDPFQKLNILELVEAGAAADGKPEGGKGLPVARPKGGEQLPSTAVMAEADRIGAIRDMQRDIVRRRRRNFTMLMLRLAFFIFLPTIAAGYYFAAIATPLYATKAEFLIQQAEPQGGMGGLSSMFRGTSLATSQDAIAVQSYLQSRDAMMRLDAERGFKKHFSQSFIDPLQRLDPGASNETAYKLYKRKVKISYDPTEGIVRMEVMAADPATSQAYAEALLGFAEERVDNLTQRVREDQMKGARESYADAERKASAAQDKVLALQEKLGVLDPQVESGIVMAQVGELEGMVRRKELELNQLMDNVRPNQARVDGVQGDLARLRAQIADLRGEMTDGTKDNLSLAQITGQLRIAETELATRRQMLAQTLQQLETARIEANRQVRYLSLSVIPVAPDDPTYPRKFEDTALWFMIFAGIYLMLSLTASILREQVTS